MITTPEPRHPRIAADEFQAKAAVFLDAGETFIKAVEPTAVDVDLQHGAGCQQPNHERNHELNQCNAKL